MPTPPALFEFRYLDAQRAAQTPPADAFWRQLSVLDSCVSRPSPGTVGHVAGDRLHVQWWIASEDQFFAAQILDTEACCQWEIFHVPAREDDEIAGVRMVWGSQSAVEHVASIWDAAFRSVLLEPVDGGLLPGFVELLAAASSPGGLTAVRDQQARLAHLESDVEYWMQLARGQAQALRKRSQAQPTWKPDLTSAPSPDEPSELRVWRLREIDLWAAENADRIVILPRALSATRRSHYENEQFLFDCLELLATEYTQVKLGLADRFAFKRRADEMGLEYGGSVEPSTRGMYGDQYLIRWRGQKRVLDQHLSKGSARDPRFCLRIYFTWDDVEGKVVVGSMPAHLDTTGS